MSLGFKRLIMFREIIAACCNNHNYYLLNAILLLLLLITVILLLLLLLTVLLLLLLLLIIKEIIKTTRTNPSSGKWNYGPEICREFCRKWRLPLHFWVLLHAVNLRHGTDGFTSLPKVGVLRIFSPEKSYGFGRV